MKQSRTIAVVVVIVTVLLAVVTLWAPSPSTQSAFGFHAQFLEGVVTAGLLVGAAPILLLSLRSFTPKFKRAYAAVCAGYGIMSLSFLQIPLLTFVSPKIVDLPWVSSGAIVLPFAVSAGLLYAGTRSFARLFGARGPLTWWWLMIVTSLACAGIGIILPHAAWDGQSERVFDGTVGSVFITVVPVMFAGLVAYQAKARASALYVPFLKGIAAVTLCATLSPWLELLAAYVIHNGIDVVASGIMLIPLVIAGAALLVVAVQFNSQMANEQYVVPQATQADAAADTSRLAIDAVTCVAQLVSSPQAIDPILDSVRAVTSNLAPGQPVSPEQQAILLTVYQKLEDYLATQEPIRRRSALEVRQIVQKTLPPTLAASSFWRQLPQAVPLQPPEAAVYIS